MVGVLSTNNRSQSVSIAVMNSVMECHDQGFSFLGGMTPGAEDVQESDTPATGAARRLAELMGRNRDKKIRYLSEAGMSDGEVASLIALVTQWLDDAGLERLGSLSRTAVAGDLGPGHVLKQWINAKSQLDLALLLDGARIDGARIDGARIDGARIDGARIKGWELSVAYAFARASELVLASYWSDSVPDDKFISLVPGDELD